jgi:hypothetical protein
MICMEKISDELKWKWKKVEMKKELIEKYF